MNTLTMTPTAAALSLERQIKSKQWEIETTERLIRERTIWLEAPENKSRFNYTHVVVDRLQLYGMLDQAKKDLQKLDERFVRDGTMKFLHRLRPGGCPCRMKPVGEADLLEFDL